MHAARCIGKVTRLLPRGARDRRVFYSFYRAMVPTGCDYEQDESGAYGIRTRDLLNAIEALYQLS
jgi:hypothetical protein